MKGVPLSFYRLETREVARTLHCTVLHCTVLYCTILFCTVLYCAVLYCTVQCSAVDKLNAENRQPTAFGVFRWQPYSAPWGPTGF